MSATIDGQETQTDVEALVWSDIVRDSMSHTIPATYSAMLRTAWAYIGSGALWRLMQLRKGPVIAALYPVLMLSVQALLALGAAWGVMRGVTLLIGFIPELAGLGPYAGLVLGLGVAWGLLAWFRSRTPSFLSTISCMITPIRRAIWVQTRLSLRRGWLSLVTLLPRL